MSLLVVTEFFEQLQMVFEPIYWCVYGRLWLCFRGELGWLSNFLSNSMLVVVSTFYVWLQWHLIWKR